MIITVSTQQGRVPVTVVKLRGELDASNYSQLLEGVEALIREGARDFLIDLEEVPFMSSAGLVALHTIAITLRGETPVSPEAGWEALKSIDRSRASGLQKHIKLLNPQERVAEIFDTAGFSEFLELYMDMPTAVASF